MSRQRERSIIVAGHICLDITPIFSERIILKLKDVFTPGKLVTMRGVDIHPGGAVANTGLALKILGADVTLMGKIGNDSFGQLILSALESYEAAGSMSISRDSSTSYSVVLAPPGIDRIFLHDPGANDNFGIDDLDFKAIQNTSLFHFGYPTIMKRMYENKGAQLIEIFKRVKELGVATSLDMAALDDESGGGKEDWAWIIQKVLPYVDFFVPSAEELAFMINKPLYKQWCQQANGKDITNVLSIEKDISPLGNQLIKWGAAVVLIKCGGKGLYFRTANRERLKQIGTKVPPLVGWSNIEAMEECYKPKAVISGTGAGDTTIAAFLYAMLQGYDWNKSLKLSCATGASCVEAYDALSGILPFQLLNQKIEKGWEKQRLQLKTWLYNEKLKYWSPPQ